MEKLTLPPIQSCDSFRLGTAPTSIGNKSPGIIPTAGDLEPIISINPPRLFYGVISSGFYYNLVFTIQNNSLGPIRIKVSCQPVDTERNAIRILTLPDRVAPGMSVSVALELAAEFSGHSSFQLQVGQNIDRRIYTRYIEAHIVTPETFKYVKKSLQLQKRPIYRKNVTSEGSMPGFDAVSHTSQVTTLSEMLILDNEEIDDLLDLPLVENVYWDPFDKKLRIDPAVGKVIAGRDLTLDDSIRQTHQCRAQRLVELEEQGFYTLSKMEHLRKDKSLGIFGKEEDDEVNDFADTDSSLGKGDTDDDTAAEEKEDKVDGFDSSQTSNRSRLSVSSLLAIKRERIDKLRRASVTAAEAFAKSSREDSMVNSMRTLSMIQGRAHSVHAHSR